MKKYLFCILVAFYLPSLSAGNINFTDYVNAIRIPYWSNDDSACIKVGNKWFKLDLTTERGKVSYSLALTASSTKKEVKVRWLDTDPLEGGCDTGTTMFPLYSIEISGS